jgi:hypothetical protein
MSRSTILSVAFLALALTGRSYPGQESRGVVLRKSVNTGGMPANSSPGRKKVRSVNGTHTWNDFVAGCGGESLVCDTGSRKDCLVSFSTALSG